MLALTSSYITEIISLLLLEAMGREGRLAIHDHRAQRNEFVLKLFWDQDLPISLQFGQYRPKKLHHSVKAFDSWPSIHDHSIHDQLIDIIFLAAILATRPGPSYIVVIWFHEFIRFMNWSGWHSIHCFYTHRHGFVGWDRTCCHEPWILQNITTIWSCFPLDSCSKGDDIQFLAITLIDMIFIGVWWLMFLLRQSSSLIVIWSCFAF